MTDRAPGAPRDRLDGATAGTVRNAIETRDPLPGTAGFAGELDGRLVRDVLGRRPLFVDGDAWAFDPEATDGTTVDVVETGARATVVLDRNGHGARLHTPPARTHPGAE